MQRIQSLKQNCSAANVHSHSLCQDSKSSTEIYPPKKELSLYMKRKLHKKHMVLP